MRRLNGAQLTLVFAVCCLSGCSLSDSIRQQHPVFKDAQTDPVFSCRCSTAERYLVGDPVILDINVTNGSSSRASFTLTTPESDFEIILMREEAMVSLTDEGTRLQNDGGIMGFENGTNLSVWLEPGETKHTSIHLSRLFSINMSGKYHVIARRIFSPEDVNPTTFSCRFEEK
jgi:hypothetical protein